MLKRTLSIIGTLLTLCLSFALYAAPSDGIGHQRQAVIDHWTATRRGGAIPRDLVIDRQGRGFLRAERGRLSPYGQGIEPRAKPGGGDGDSTPPSISNMDPGGGDAILADHRFSATITDDSGIKSVSFTVRYPDGNTTQTFNPTQESGTDTWSVNLQGFTDGNWSWWVTAKDRGARGGNTSTSTVIGFVVITGGTEPPPPPPAPPAGSITNAEWTFRGTVKSAVGRIYFEMPKNQKRKGPWQGFVCSGTVVDDGVGGRSLVLTAAHCVYDDVNKAFARNVLFIPDQAGTSGSGTDTQCGNDPIGCWVPSLGVVDVRWTTRLFPENIAWDYAFYVVDDMGAHAQGPTTTNDVLDFTAGSMTLHFLTPDHDDGVTGPGPDSPDFTHALGYSYSEDPNFMYCAEDMTTVGTVNWWLPNCGLSGGSSGGPWIQPMDEGAGNGPIISVNSWGYANSPGMAGPKLSGLSALCVFAEAKVGDLQPSGADGEAGVAVDCSSP